MNCPRGLHSKEREKGNTCSHTLEIGIFLLCLLQRVIIIGPIYIEIERKMIMEQVKKYEYLDETFYTSIKELLEQARKRIYRNVNSEMVLTYWQIGKMIVEKQGESRADYGAGLIKELAIKLSEEYGRSFSKRNLWFMRQFFLTFRKVNAVSSQLSWTHYKMLLRVENEEARNFYIDLVLYNYKLKCFVLIDLKRGDLTHQDIDQMQMYVNYYTRELMEPGDNPPIGIVLCADKSDTLVRYTLPLDNKQIYASKYMLYLPKEEELQNEVNKQRELFMSKRNED